MNKVKLQTLVSSPAEAQVIKHLAYNMKTATRKYKTGFKREITAADHDLLVRVDRHTATDFLKLSNDDNVTIYADRGSTKSGKKAVLRVKQGTTATIEFPVYPSILQWSGNYYYNRF